MIDSAMINETKFVCPFYDQKKRSVHGLRCSLPVFGSTSGDCRGSITSNDCSVDKETFSIFVKRLIGTTDFAIRI